MKTLLKYLWLLIPFNLAAENKRNYDIKEISNEAIKVDGYLNEKEWKQATIANQFVQWIPNPDQPSSYQTEVRLLYNNRSLYIAAVMYQDQKLLLKQMTARDELNRCNADIFTVVLDTYHDQQNAYVFKVSAAGVQQDERISGGLENGDITWDAVWDSKVVTDGEKWTVEMEIPYSAIRFSKSANQVWGINFSRLVRKVNESSYWSPLDIKRQGFLAQAGTLTGLKNLHPPVRLFFYPYLTTGYYNKPESGSNETGYLNGGGVDVKYGINESFTIDATLIPNFSQVISDNLIRNLSPFEQQLSENRPFFTEGVELFNKANIFYSRRVGSQPDGYSSSRNELGDTSKFNLIKNPNVTTLYNAIKLSGRNKRNIGIGVFNAIGAPMYATYFDKQSELTLKRKTEPLTNYNVVVIDKPLKGQSFINLTNTNLWANGIETDANVTSVQWLQFTPKEKHSFSLSGKLSSQFDSKHKFGTSWLTEFKKTSGKFRYILVAETKSPNYDQSDMGIQFDYNHTYQFIQFSYNENKPKLPFLINYRISTEHTFRQNTVPFVFKDYQAKANYFWLFKNFWDLNLEVETKPFTPVDFYFLRSFNKKLKLNPYFWTGFGGSSDSRKKLFWGFYTGYGFSNNQKTGYFYIEHSLRYLLFNKLELSIRGSATRDDSNIGYALYDEDLEVPVIGQRFVREYEGNFGVKYNFSPNVNFTARFRHYNSFLTYRSLHRVSESGYWRSNPYPYVSGLNENFNLQNIDVFFNWMFKPGSRLVISYKQWLQDAYILNSRTENQYYNNVYEVIKTPQAYEIAVRLIYFHDYNKLKRRKLKSYE